MSTSPSSPGVLRAILRQHKQDRRSCLACRERKVKCSRTLPCTTCIKRGHPSLCSFRVAGAQSSAGSPAPGAPSAPSLDTSRPAIGSARGVSELPRHDPVPAPGSTSANLSNETARQAAFETGVGPLLGSHFGPRSLLSPESQARALRDTLPSGGELVGLFACYRTRVHPFSIITPDIDDIEAKLCFLINSGTGSGDRFSTGSAEDIQWFGLLHAILSSGAQMSDMPPDRRRSVSQKHCGLHIEPKDDRS